MEKSSAPYLQEFDTNAEHKRALKNSKIRIARTAIAGTPVLVVTAEGIKEIKTEKDKIAHFNELNKQWSGQFPGLFRKSKNRKAV